MLPRRKHMKTTTVLTSALALIALTACNPFHRDRAVAVSTDVNNNLRWNASLTSPSELVGVVRMGGTALMQPAANGSSTRIAVDLNNASPGSSHPWQVHYGQCGDDRGVFGPVESYNSLKVSDEGRASVAVNVPL